MGGPETTADTRTFEPDPVRQLRYREFLDRHIPGFIATELYPKTCLYTLPPDQNFVLDSLPDDPRIVVAVGAGHPIDAFALDRPAVTHGAFQRTFHI